MPVHFHINCSLGLPQAFSAGLLSLAATSSGSTLVKIPNVLSLINCFLNNSPNHLMSYMLLSCNIFISADTYTGNVVNTQTFWVGSHSKSVAGQLSACKHQGPIWVPLEFLATPLPTLPGRQSSGL